MSEWKGEPFGSAADVPAELREPLADLILVLADSKRLLGMRYADWILGAPALEAGISCSAMAQDEWGHGRILYAMLGEFDLDPDHLEHEREPSEYRNAVVLDEAPESWPELLALMVLLDGVLTVQFEAMRHSRFEPVHHKVAKLLEEERYHFEHGRGWTLRLAETEKGRAALREAFDPAWEECLRWFGPGDDPAAISLAEAGVVSGGPEELRERWLHRVGPVVEAAGLDLARPDGEGRWGSVVSPEDPWSDWTASSRRPREAGGPDEETIRRVRGDRNRSLLLD